MNLLLPTAGRSSDSFVMNDLMRLPLGILTGVGFIGGGQIALGVVVIAIAVAALWVLQWTETRLRRERRAGLRALNLSGVYGLSIFRSVRKSNHRGEQH